MNLYTHCKANVPGVSPLGIVDLKVFGALPDGDTIIVVATLAASAQPPGGQSWKLLPDDLRPPG